MTAPAPAIAAGDWIDGYQVQAQAPVDFIRGSRTRYLDGHAVKGAWSDPWWLYCPERGWAFVRRWRSKAQTGLDWTGGTHLAALRRRPAVVEIPARDEIVVEPYGEACAA